MFEFDVGNCIDRNGASIRPAVFDSPPAITIVGNILRGVDRNCIAAGVAAGAARALDARCLATEEAADVAASGASVR